MAKSSLFVLLLATWFLLSPPQALQTKDILIGTRLVLGYGMGVNSSGGRTDWLKKEDGFMSMSYPAGQEWGAVFVTVGRLKAPPRPSQDFSAYNFLSVEMKGQTGREEVEIGVKTNTQDDDGLETKLPVKLSADWRTYNFALDKFTGTDAKRLYVVIEFVFTGDEAQSVFFRNIKYSAKEQPQPPPTPQAQRQEPQRAEKRVALVIGNQKYKDAPLRSPVNDARDVTKTLEECKFDVLSYENLTRKEMVESIRKFGEQLSPGSVALFYYAGHGLQIDGVNYLVPVGHDIRKKPDVENEALNVERVLAEMVAARTRTNIIILDACRNNPYRGFDVFGLAPMNAPTGSIIAYATGPNEVAVETSEHGVYTKALVEAMREHCLEIEPMFKKVREKMANETAKNGRPQIPWENTSLIGEFRFKDSGCVVESATGACVGRRAGDAKSFSVDKGFELAVKMGDIDDVKIIRLADSTRFEYTPTGRGSHEWEYKYVDGKLNPAPAQFGGVIYTAPGTRFGTLCGGFDLRRYRRVLRWEARSLQDDQVNVDFVIGGANWIWENGKQTDTTYPDSMPKKEFRTKPLTKEWQPFEADLSGLDEAAFSRVLAGFAWAISWDANGVSLNPKGTGVDKRRTFKIEIRNVRYEARADRAAEANRVSKQWQEKVSSIVWVAYASPSSDPENGVEPTPENIRRELLTLRKAGFTGLVTYGSQGVMGSGLVSLAESLGFQGVILGVWDPADRDELDAAKSQAQSSLVLGYCVGNEGLGKRYDRQTLLDAMREIREQTKKHVTTSEEFDDYKDDDVLKLGDWIFPNAHPYFQNILEPVAAARWTQGAYEDLLRRGNHFVLLKEVGLPTSGDAGGQLSEAAQESYYTELAKTPAKFVYFEAFDLPWKKHLPVEPHWGLFRRDQTPKRLASRFLRESVPLTSPRAVPAPIPPRVAPVEERFYVYEDARSPRNHFTPSGYMGDSGDVKIDEAFAANPRSGKTSIRVTYTAKGDGPRHCNYAPPCKWAGVYWQHPPNNWGDKEQMRGKGFDLSGYGRLRFWARAEKDCTVEFNVGGISQRYGDSLPYPRSLRARLTKEWQEFEIALDGANLKHLIGGFGWASSWGDNPDGAVFYLDDIRFEKR